MTEVQNKTAGTCLYCRRAVADNEHVKLQAKDTGEIRVAHKDCREQTLRREVIDLEWRNRLNRENLVCSWNTSINEDLATFPKWEFARVENAEFMRRVSKTVATGILNWSFVGSLFVSAATGSGKTALTVARLHQQFARYMADQAVDPTQERNLSFAFLSGPALAGCRRRAKIGGESKLVELAIDTRLLVLDELGYEPVSEELLTVVDARHKLGKRTITTTGRTLESFVERYGGSLFRKLTENGTTVEGWT